jgi:hypothetical protein
MHERFIEALTETHRPWVLVSGTLDERISQAVRCIDAVLSGQELNTEKILELGK